MTANAHAVLAPHRVPTSKKRYAVCYDVPNKSPFTAYV